MVDGNPFQVLEVAHQHIGRGGSSVQTKIKNVRTGQVLSRNYKPADSFDEAEIEKKPAQFIYAQRGEYWFAPKDNPRGRFALKDEVIGEGARFLKANLEVTALYLNGTVMNILLPIKVDLKVVEAAPAVKGNTAQGATKTVKLESGAEIQVPLFINEGDVVRVNTATGDYTERMEKG